jgi:hypothetical protein
VKPKQDFSASTLTIYSNQRGQKKNGVIWHTIYLLRARPKKINSPAHPEVKPPAGHPLSAAPSASCWTAAPPGRRGASPRPPSSRPAPARPNPVTYNRRKYTQHVNFFAHEE